MQVSDAHLPLHNGTTVDIRPKSLLGEKYVNIHDGSATNSPLDTAVVLHETQKAVPVELDLFINSLDESTRNAARVLLNDLGAGVAGRRKGRDQDHTAAERADSSRSQTAPTECSRLNTTTSSNSTALSAA